MESSAALQLRHAAFFSHEVKDELIRHQFESEVLTWYRGHLPHWPWGQRASPSAGCDPWCSGLFLLPLDPWQVTLLLQLDPERKRRMKEEHRFTSRAELSPCSLQEDTAWLHINTSIWFYSRQTWNGPHRTLGLVWTTIFLSETLIFRFPISESRSNII